MLTAVVIDDEKLARESLVCLLEEFCSDVEIFGTAKSAKEGFQLINETNPDLVFLDIEMPDKNGFDLLSMFDQINFQIIFTTAHGHYAIQAIKFSALDFILKPIDKQDLLGSVERARTKFKEENTQEFERSQIGVLLSNISENGTAFQKIVIPESSGFRIQDIEEIVYLKSDGSYCEIYTMKDKVISSRTLKEYESMLQPYRFMRVSKSFLINLNKIVEYKKGEGGTAVMTDGSRVEVSRRKKKEFLKHFLV